MVVICPNLKYDPCGTHISTNLFSSSKPYVQLTRLPQNGLMTLCNDELVFSTNRNCGFFN